MHHDMYTFAAITFFLWGILYKGDFYFRGCRGGGEVNPERGFVFREKSMLGRGFNIYASTLVKTCLNYVVLNENINEKIIGGVLFYSE